MGKCDNCRLRKESAKAFDIHWLGEDDCPYDKCPVPDFPKTNADRIRGMSDEELSEFIGDDPMHDICPNNCHEDLDRPCKVCVLDWLKQEATDG